MRKKLLLLFVIIIIGCSMPIENKAWLEDFEMLKKEMTIGYANLKYATEKENIDIIKLNQVTTSKLKHAKTIEEAQKVIKKFLKTFDDGHLRASKLKVADKVDTVDAKNSETDYLKNTDSGAIALKKMGYTDWKYKNRIKYDSIPGYNSLNSQENPFSASIIKRNNETIGIIRIGFLGAWGYWNTALQVWESYKKTFEGKCDGDCQWSFGEKVEIELTNKIIDRINELKSNKISKLLVDVSSNPGGSEWCHAVAELFTDKHLKGAESFFVKHNHWKNSLEGLLESIESDLSNPKLKEKLKEKLKKYKNLVQDLILKCENNCSIEEVWNEQKMDCLELLSNPSSVSSLPFGIHEDDQFEELNIKSSLSSYRFLTYKKGVYDGPLFIIQDRYSGSATEEFTSVFQANNAAVIVGEDSYGAGCGYTNGGIKSELKNIGLSVRMPDCVRLRKDGKNEIYGINPDIEVQWSKEESEYSKGQKIIQAIEKYAQSRN